VAQNPTDRRGNVTGRERRRRDLIQERLKDVMVAAIDQRDTYVGVAERPCGGQATKAAANDDNVG
jgi:hypothetical protein